MNKRLNRKEVLNNRLKSENKELRNELAKNLKKTFLRYHNFVGFLV